MGKRQVKGKTYIQNIQDSETRPNLYILYDRTYIGASQWLWMSWQQPPEEEGPVFFFSEHEARMWLDESITGRVFPSDRSHIYAIELDALTSTQILLSDNKQERLKELATEELVEELWLQQYGRSKYDSTQR